MGMNRFRDVSGGRAHLDGKDAFADEFARAVADDTDAEHPLGLDRKSVV